MLIWDEASIHIEYVIWMEICFIAFLQQYGAYMCIYFGNKNILFLHFFRHYNDTKRENVLCFFRGISSWNIREKRRFGLRHLRYLDAILFIKWVYLFLCQRVQLKVKIWRQKKHFEHFILHHLLQFLFCKFYFPSIKMFFEIFL